MNNDYETRAHFNINSNEPPRKETGPLIFGVLVAVVVGIFAATKISKRSPVIDCSTKADTVYVQTTVAYDTVIILPPNKTDTIFLTNQPQITNENN